MKKTIMLISAVIVLAALFASSQPDGLEKTADWLGFSEKGIERGALFACYTFPRLHQGTISTIAAVLFGVFVIWGIFWVTASLLKRV